MSRAHLQQILKPRNIDFDFSVIPTDSFIGSFTSDFSDPDNPRVTVTLLRD